MDKRRFSKFLPLVVMGFGLSACSESVQQRFTNLDFDLRGEAGGLDTSQAARTATQNRPRPDANGIISYPNYQVAVAQRGDTLSDVADRAGVNPGELARYNGRNVNDPLRQGEVIALPRRVATAPAETRNTPLDITAIATTAIDRAPAGQVPVATTKRIDGPEPIRHQVERGETAYSIARLYNVSPRSLSEWNGLGPDLTVREGQYLLIPVAKEGAEPIQVASPAPVAVQPGAGTPLPEPPSAKKPLPEDVEPVAAPAQPSVAASAAAKPAPATATARFLQPVAGSTLRAYKERKNEGIDIQAATGTAVKAAADGEVAAITRDTDQEAILVLRHGKISNGKDILTIYANIDSISVKKGDRIRRGQSIAKVAPGDPSFLHFEVREGFESVNPAKYLE